MLLSNPSFFSKSSQKSDQSKAASRCPGRTRLSFQRKYFKESIATPNILATIASASEGIRHSTLTFWGTCKKASFTSTDQIDQLNAKQSIGMILVSAGEVAGLKTSSLFSTVLYSLATSLDLLCQHLSVVTALAFHSREITWFRGRPSHSIRVDQ